MSNKVNNDIIFNVIDWADKDDIDETEDDEVLSDVSYVIEAYGKTEEGKSIYLKINGFLPYFFVEIPKSWDRTQVRRFTEYIRMKTYGKYQNALKKVDIQKSYLLY